MSIEIICDFCSESYFRGKAGDLSVSTLAEYISPHLPHTRTYTIKILRSTYVSIIHSFFVSTEEINWSASAKIKGWVDERMAEIAIDEKIELLDQIQDTLQYISEKEEKLAVEAKFESSVHFHRGRQLLAIDICKSINDIFKRNK